MVTQAEFPLVHLDPAASSRERDRLAVELDGACAGTGFVLVAGHRLERLLADVFAQARAFFDLPQQAKEQVPRATSFGYVPRQQSAIDTTRPTGTTEYLDLSLAPHFDADIGATTPPLTGFAPATPPHTDYGALTLLATGDTPGLEVRGRDGNWLPVDAPPGALVVNVGDMLARWTNLRWASTRHRVVAGATHRYSVPFFVNPDPDTMVDCLPSCVGPGNPCRFEPVTASAFLAGRIAKTIPEPFLD